MADQQPFFSYAKNLTFIICYIISFALMEGPKSMETIGIILFLMVHFIFSLSYGYDIAGFFMSDYQSTGYTLRLWTIFFSIVLSVAAAVMLALTIGKLQSTFAAAGLPLELNGENRDKMDKLETIFITVVVFLGTMGLNVYYTPDSLFTFMFESLKNISNVGKYFMVILPFVCLGVGSALYERMRDHCDSNEIQSFKSNFHTTYWLLFGIVALFIFKRVAEWLVFPHFRGIEKNLLLNPFIFGNTFIFRIIGILIIVASTILIGISAGQKSDGINTIGPNLWPIFLVVFVACLILLLAPELAKTLLRWDMFMDLAKWGLSISAVVFAGFSIRDYIGLNRKDGCFKHDLANLYVIFITCLFVIFFLTVVTPLQLTKLVINVVRYLVPPTTLALSAYLVYLTNDMAHLSKSDLVA